MKKYFIEHIELWLSAVGIGIIWVVPLVVPPGGYVEEYWRVVAITAIAVGVVHGVIFWAVRRRQEKRKAETRALLQAQKEALERRVAKQMEQVQALSSALTLAEQRERQAISYVLHDDLQQQLYGIQMQTHFLLDDAKTRGQDAVREQAGDIYTALGEAVRKTRTLAIELNPPVLPEAGLQAALAWLAHQMEEEYSLSVDVQAEASPRVPSEEMRVLLVRTVRELLFNVVKHANVDQATVRLSHVEPDFIRIDVIDQGVGFCAACAEDKRNVADPAVGGFGLYSVRERVRLFGGELEIASHKGGGTCATILVPATAGLSLDAPALDVLPQPEVER